jgi:prevent-host-death family protein
MAMTNVGVAQLKARLSEYLRRVREGAEVIVLDRKTPIARIVPVTGDMTPLSVRRPKRGAPPPGRVPLPRPLPLPVDVVALLLEERQGGR